LLKKEEQAMRNIMNKRLSSYKVFFVALSFLCVENIMARVATQAQQTQRVTPQVQPGQKVMPRAPQVQRVAPQTQQAQRVIPQAQPILGDRGNIVGQASLEKERQLEARRAGIQKESLTDIESSNAPDLYTQSQAHLRLKKVRTLIKDKFSDKVVPYFDIISRMITKEAELKNSHYVFYHAAASITAVQADLFTQLYFYEHPEAKRSDDEFRFLRFQGESKDMTVKEFVAGEMRESGLIDDSGTLGAYLLSVNLAIFGNVGSSTECTWHWFFNSRSVPKPDIFETIMKTFGLTNKYNKDIIALNDIIEMPEGSILQICIPKDMVDELVYLAWIRGVPATGPIMDWVKEYQASSKVPKRDRSSLAHTKQSREALAKVFKKEQEKNPIFKEFMKNLEAGDFSTYAFLRAYCNKPKELPNLNDTAGRILFTKEGLLKPASGIKFYRYLSTPREKIEEYTKKLNSIVQKLIDEKEAQEGAKVKKVVGKK
jgi:hypothetical protein